MTPPPLHYESASTEKATFCMGCYWAPECTFGVLAGVIRTRVGHAGPDENASIEECHEAIEMDFDPAVVTYKQLLDVFWLHHDPTLEVPVEYASAILYHNPAQRELAERSVAEQKQGGKPVLTKVLPAKVFFDAPNKNQKYRLQQHPWLMEAVGLTGASDAVLADSHVAARLNGYVVGAGGAAQFEQELASLGLSPAAAEYVGNLVREHQGNVPGGGCALPAKQPAGGEAAATLSS